MRVIEDRALHEEEDLEVDLAAVLEAVLEAIQEIIEELVQVLVVERKLAEEKTEPVILSQEVCIENMDFVKHSYESLVYIPVRELEPVKLYVSNRNDQWLNSLLSRSGWFTWDIMDKSFKDTSFIDPDIRWCLKEGNPFEEETDPYKIREVD